MTIDEIIEKVTGRSVESEGGRHSLMFYLDEVRAVAEAAMRESNERADRYEKIARECKQQYHDRRDALINARRELVLELLAMPGYADDVIMRLTEIAEEGE